MYSLELLCSCSHAGGETLTWSNTLWRAAGVMLELLATMVSHRYTMLARGDTLTWSNIFWRAAGVMLELLATMVPHRYTGLARMVL